MQVTFFAAPIALLVLVAVIVGLVMLVRALAPGSGPKVALGVGVLLAVLLFAMFIGYSRPMMVRPPLAQNGFADEPTESFRALPPRVEMRPENPTASVSETTKPSPSKEPPSTTPDKPNAKPAWLTQELQTGNRVSQFVVSSEILETIADCQRDLDRRMPTLIAEQVKFICGEEYPITLLPGEAQSLVAETYTEERPIGSSTIWYRIHRLIKVDQITWDTFSARFRQAQLHARLVSLGLGLGGVMLILGVAYLILRRPPRVVDPTLNTFSTT